MPRGFSGRPAARQRKHWHQLQNSSIIELTGNGTTLIDSFDASGREPYTVLRMVGEVSASPDEAAVVAGDSCIITFGIGVVSTDAAALGSTAMPDPGAEADYPWLWWHGATMHFPAIGEALQNAVRVLPVQSKAMRKVAAGQSLVAVVQYVDVSGFPPIDILTAVRFLIGTS